MRPWHRSVRSAPAAEPPGHARGTGGTHGHLHLHLHLHLALAVCMHTLMRTPVGAALGVTFRGLQDHRTELHQQAPVPAEGWPPAGARRRTARTSCCACSCGAAPRPRTGMALARPSSTATQTCCGQTSSSGACRQGPGPGVGALGTGGPVAQQQAGRLEAAAGVPAACAGASRCSPGRQFTMQAA